MCISIVTINYNTSSKTIDLIDSIKKLVHLPYEIIVIDNASEQLDYQKLVRYCEQQINVKLIRNKVNSGFGAGNMLGGNYASFPYIAFINNDVVLLEDSLTKLTEFMDSNVSIGVVTAQQTSETGELIKSFDYNHGIRKTILGRWFIELFKNKSQCRSNQSFDNPIEVDFVQGAFMLFRAEAFYKSGGFDTNIFLYCEEMDICYRLKQHGYKSYFFPNTKFQHECGGSTEASFLIKIEPKLSYLYVIRKHHNFLKYSILKYYLLLSFLIKGLKNPRYFKLSWDIWSNKILQRSIKQLQFKA